MLFLHNYFAPLFATNRLSTAHRSVNFNSCILSLLNFMTLSIKKWMEGWANFHPMSVFSQKYQLDELIFSTRPATISLNTDSDVISQPVRAIRFFSVKYGEGRGEN